VIALGETSKLIHNRKTAKFSIGDQVQLGLVSGLVSGIVMALVILALQIAWFMDVPYFLSLGTLFGAVGPSYYVGMYGVVVHFSLAVIWGLIFAFLFHTNESYSITKGLAWAGLQLLLVAIAFAFIANPQLGGTLLTIPLQGSVTLLVNLAIGYAAYGVVIGYLTKKHKQIHYTPISG
jgi:hypothetical protein